MKEYQNKKHNPYLLPHNLYMRVLYTIRDYDRLREERKEILYGTFSSAMGGSRGSVPGDPVATAAQRLAVVDTELKAIDQELEALPPEYRRGVFENIRKGDWYPIDADERTYRRWKQRFIFGVAKKLYHL